MARYSTNLSSSSTAGVAATAQTILNSAAAAQQLAETHSSSGALKTPPVRLCPSPPCLALQPLRRRRRADEQRQQRVMHPRCRLWIRARRGPSAILRTKYNPVASSTAAADPVAAATPALVDSSVRTVPLPSDSDHAEPIWELLSYGSRLLLVARRPHTQGRTPFATLLN